MKGNNGDPHCAERDSVALGEKETLLPVAFSFPALQGPSLPGRIYLDSIGASCRKTLTPGSVP